MTCSSYNIVGCGKDLWVRIEAMVFYLCLVGGRTEMVNSRRWEGSEQAKEL